MGIPLFSSFFSGKKEFKAVESNSISSNLTNPNPSYFVDIGTSATTYLPDKDFLFPFGATMNNLILTKETWCVEAADSTAGNVFVTFRMTMQNLGADDLNNIQLEDDLYGQIPVGAFIRFISANFGIGHAVTSNPVFNIAYDGKNNIQVFDGASGLIAPNETLVVDLTIEMNPNVLAQYAPVSNQAVGSGIDPIGDTVSTDSDAPLGAPGDTNDQNEKDGLLLYIPAINVAVSARDYDFHPTCDAAGNVEVTLAMVIKNTGNTLLDNLSLIQNLSANFGSAFIGLISPPTITSATSNPLPAINGNYTGTAADPEIFDDPTFTFGRNDSLTVELRVLLDPNAPSAPMPLYNQCQVSARGLFPNLDKLPGCHSGSLLAFDNSDAGTAPESQNIGFVGDTKYQDDFFPLNLSGVGLSKRILSYSPSASNTAGNLDVVFRINLKNTGNTQLTNIDLTDDITTMLGNSYVGLVQFPNIISSNATSNPSIGVFPNIFNGTNGVLFPNQNITVDFKVEMNPDAMGITYPLTNSATTSADGIGLDGNTFIVFDKSDSGPNPENINAGQPGDNGCDSNALVINLPAIRVAQHIAGVDEATSGIGGHFDVIVQVLVQNVGSVGLTDFSLLENLTLPSQLGSAFDAVIGVPQIIPVGINGTISNATTNPSANPAYDGSNDLLLSSGQLHPGELFIIQYRIEVNPKAPGAPTMLRLQAIGKGTGDGPAGTPIEVSDASDSGYITQSNNLGRPGDSGGSDDPTPLTNCYEEMSGGLSCNTSVQVSLNGDCIASLTPPMVLEGEEEDCASDDLLPLGTYYEILMVKTLMGMPIPDLVPATPNVHEIDGSFIGQTLSVKVREKVHKNTCWGYIHLEDKMGPEFECPDTAVVIPCSQSAPYITEPELIDNCDPDPEVKFGGEQVTDNDICDGIYKIERTYTGNDEHGNPALPCTVEIHLERGGIEFPIDVSWHCEQYSNFPGITDPIALNPLITDSDPTDPSDIDAAANLSNNILQNTGSGVVANAGGVCGYNILHSDDVIPMCGTSFKIVRTWMVIDWCTSEIITEDSEGNDNVQVIKIEDKVAPVVTKAPFEVNADQSGTYPFPCFSKGFLPPPDDVTDNCNNNVTIQIITPAGAADYIASDGSLGGYIPSPGLPMGVHDIEYRVTDACGNTGSIVVQLTVGDNQTPTAVCDELTDVNLTSNGEAIVFAETFDDGSHDNCCLDHFEVRRMNDPCNDGHDDTKFGSTVVFCCNDVGAGKQMVVFRVFDCHNNFNDCMVEVIVNDKVNPQLVNCPANQSIDCDTYAQDYETQLAALSGDQTAQNEFLDAAFGTPTFFDNCSLTITKNFSQNLSQCLEGRMTRKWKAKDPGGLQSQTCTQRINVRHTSDWVVEFPEDIETTCGNTLPEFGEPAIFNETCEMIAVSYKDDTLNVVPDACFKIVRTWAIINWCVVGAEVDQEVIEKPESELGLIAPACDLDGDGDCDDRTFRDSWNDSAMPNNSMASQQFGPDTDPDSDPWDGYIIYQQKMKVNDITDPVFSMGCNIPDVEILDSTCTATVMLPTLNGTITDCSPVVTVTVDSDIPGGLGFGPYTNVPPDIYNVTYTAKDNCNNQMTCSTTVEVKDGKAPTVFCKEGLIVVVMNTLPPMIGLNAAQLDDGSNDNCSNLTFSFSPDTTFTDTTFFCHDIPGDSLEVWVTDELGNQDFCKTLVTVQADTATCGDDTTLVVDLVGVIDTENGIPVQDVTVNLSGQSTSVSTTDPLGGFQFLDLPKGSDLTVAPRKDDDHLNGVTTYDLVLITQHILGVTLLDSPYKIIAADANRSGTVTTFDLVEIRKLILYINDQFPNNTSWRFLPNDYSFPNPQNPWADIFPEVININNISTDVLDADFIAVKVGDVNESADANFVGGTNDDRGVESMLLLETQNHRFVVGETVTVSLSTEDFSAVGFQFTIAFDPNILSFIETQHCLTDAGHFGRRYVNDGFLTVSWNDYQSNWLEGQPLVQLAFRALQPGQLNQTIQLTDRYTPAEAYSVFGEIMNVKLAIADDLNAQFELLQNVPNPFSEKTTIGFRLAEATHAVLTVTDISGRVVKTVEGDFDAGYSEVKLDRSSLPESGLFYYCLETPRHNATKMMLLIN